MIFKTCLLFQKATVKNITDTSRLNGTSFFGTCISTNFTALVKVLGTPAYQDNTGEDKVNFEWEMETEGGDPFTVYSWKEYRPIKHNEKISWHIGGNSLAATEKAKSEIQNAIASLVLRNTL